MRTAVSLILCVTVNTAWALEPPPMWKFKDAWEKCPNVVWGTVKETHILKMKTFVTTSQDHTEEKEFDFIVVDLVVLSTWKGDSVPGTLVKFYWGKNPRMFGNKAFPEAPKAGDTMVVFLGSDAKFDAKSTNNTLGYGLGVFKCDEKTWYGMKYDNKGLPDGWLDGEGKAGK